MYINVHAKVRQIFPSCLCTATVMLVIMLLCFKNSCCYIADKGPLKKNCCIVVYRTPTTFIGKFTLKFTILHKHLPIVSPPLWNFRIWVWSGVPLCTCEIIPWLPYEAIHKFFLASFPWTDIYQNFASCTNTFPSMFMNSINVKMTNPKMAMEYEKFSKGTEFQ